MKENDLISNRALLSSIINNFSDVEIFSLDKNGCYTSFNNKHFIEIKKRCDTNIEIGANFLISLKDEKERNFVRHNFSKALSGETIKELFNSIANYKSYEYNFNPVSDENVITGVSVLIKEVSQKKKSSNNSNTSNNSEKENDLHRDIFYEGRANYELLLNKIQSAVVVHGSNTQILSSNAKAQELLGLTEDQLLGKTAIDPSWHFFHVDGTIMPISEYPVNIVFEEKKELRNYQLGIHRPQNNYDVWVNVNAEPIFDSHNKIKQVIVTFTDITESKNLNEKLKESEKTIRKKLDSILSPDFDDELFELNDIINSEKIQKLMDELYQITKIGIGIIDIKGNVLVGTGWQNICTKFHRINPNSCKLCEESDFELSQNVPEGTFKMYHCKNNMWDISTPIMIGGKHVGNIFLGQFLFDDEEPDYNLFKEQAKKFGFDEKEYLAALDAVPRWSKETVNAAMTFYSSFAQILGNLGYNNTKFANTLVRQKYIENALQEKQKLLLEAQEIAHIGNWWHDLKTGEIYWSDEFFRIIGLPQQKPTLDLAGEILHPDDLVILENAMKESEAGKMEHEQEFRIIRPTGEIRWVHNRWIRINDKDGNEIKRIGTHQDITERKLAEEERNVHLWFLKSLNKIDEIIQSTNDFEKMINQALDLVLTTLNCDRVYLTYPCDPYAESWSVPFEKTKPEYPGITLGEQIPMSDGLAASMKYHLNAESPVKSNPEFPVPEDVAKNFMVKSNMSMAIFPKIGNAWLFGVHQCSYNRDWNEQEVRLFQEVGRRLADAMTSLISFKNLKESEERYRMVFENSPVSIWEEDFSPVKKIFDDLKKQGITNIEEYFERKPEIVKQCADSIRILDVNQAALDLHKAKSKEGLMEALVETFTPESFTVFKKELIGLWNDVKEMSNDAIVKTLDGEQRNVTVYFSVCPGYEKSLSKTLVSLVDITKRKKAQQKIQELNKELELRVLERTSQLEIANKELEAFSYSVSHDLRAPLRGVIGFSEILNNEYKKTLNERGQKYLDLVQESAHRMSQLIDDMLKLSRVTQSDINIGKVDLSQIVVKIVEGLQNLEPNRKVKFQIQETVIVNADKHLMQIVMQNLLDNAWKYSSKKELSIIEFGMIEKDGINVCYVKDNGVGFNMNYKNKLFKTFQRLHTANEFSGTGIGLATVKRILDKHRGKVWVEAEEGIGATIYFSLP